MRDEHIHYTGALPKSLYYKHYPKDQVDELFSAIDTGWNDNYLNNYVHFFDSYRSLQLLSKQIINIDYKTGTEYILESQYRQGITGLTLLIGADKNFDDFHQRLENTIQAADNFEANNGFQTKIRITFIRDDNGTYKNWDEDFLSEFSHTITRDPSLKYRLAGFDFSGIEFPDRASETLLYHNHIHDRFCKKNNVFDISVHAGENFTSNSMLQFEQLIKGGVNRIVHGTFLWLPKANKENKDLLRLFGRNTGIFDICPTANMRMTPLANKKEIPLENFQEFGISYNICSDNPVIFNTNAFIEKSGLGI